ncbi:MAG: DUF4347 domain-containing protein [Microcoleaceae cyanobacterium]
MSSSTISSSKSTVVIIDNSVKDIHFLLGAIQPGAEVIHLDSQSDGIEQITQTISQFDTVQSLHILTHGNAGCLTLGNTQLCLNNLKSYAPHLRRWQTALTIDADLFLYACQVALGKGIQFVQRLAQLTQTNVAASRKLLGNPALLGHGTLDTYIGAVETSPVFSPEILSAYPHVLVRLIEEDFSDEELTIQPLTDELRWIFGTRQSVGNSDDLESPFLTAREERELQPNGIPGVPSSFSVDAPGTGALRLTSNVNDETGFVIYDFPLRSDAGLVVEFDFHAYNTTTDRAADGFSFFLIDGEASPQTSGGFGGSLGYAPRTDRGIPGLTGGYLGIGFDEFGNFANPIEGREGGLERTPNAITLRGSEAGNYSFLTTTGTLDFDLGVPGTTNREDARRSVRIEISQAGVLTIFIDTDLDQDIEDNEVVIENFDVLAENDGVLPESIKFGFAASTGLFNNIHEISNLQVDTIAEPPVLDLNSEEQGVNFDTVFTEGEAAVVIANQTNITDGDDDQMAGATIVLTNPLNGSEEGLSFTNDAQSLINSLGLVVTGTGTDQVEIEGLSPIENYEAIIDGILYNNLSETLDPTPRVITSVVRDELFLGFDSNVATTTVEILEIPENLPPETDDVNNPAIRNDVTRVSLLPLSGTDPDGVVEGFRITNLPIEGTLFLGGNAITQTTDIIPVNQAGSLEFTPGRDSTGVTTFEYVAIDDEAVEDPTPATFSIPITEGNIPPETQSVITDPIRVTATLAPLNPLQGTDIDGEVEGFRITQLPGRGTLFLDQEPVAPDQVVAADQADELTFTPDTNQLSENISFQYAAIDNDGAEDPRPASYIIPIIDNLPPIAEPILLETVDLGAIQVPIEPAPSGIDLDGTVVNFSLTALSPDGQLFFEGQPVNNVNQVQNVDIDQATELSFTPASDFLGTTTLRYTVTDNEGARSLNRAVIAIPVSDGSNNLSPIVENVVLDPIRNDATEVEIPPLVGEDPDGQIDFFSITRISSNGEFFLDGELVTDLAQVTNLTPEAASQLAFTPNPDFVGTASSSYIAIDNDGAESTNAALIVVSVNPRNQPPTTSDLVAAQIPNDSIQAEIPNLEGFDVDGEVVGFQITQLPESVAGRLVLDGVEISTLDQLPEQLTLEEVEDLTFNPDADFTGNTFLEYVAVDNEGAVDPDSATLTLPIIDTDNLPPTAQAVIFRFINLDEANIRLDPLVATDIDGTVESFSLTQLPTPAMGQLFLGDGTTINDLDQASNLSLEAAAELEFTPNPDFSGLAATFEFTATDNLGATGPVPATYTIPIEPNIADTFNQPPVTDNLRNPAIPENSIQASLIPLSATDPDGEVVSFRITDLPENGQLFLEDEAITSTTTLIPVDQAGDLTFTSERNFSGFADFRYAAIDDEGEEDSTPAIFIIPHTAIDDETEEDPTPPIVVPPTPPEMIDREADLPDLCEICATPPEISGINLPDVPFVEVLQPNETIDSTIAGTAGNDILVGSELNEEISGLAGNDLVVAGRGNDNLFGNEDTDLLDGGRGEDFADGGLGNDVIFGWFDSDKLIGSAGDDTLFGGTNDLTNPETDGQDSLKGGLGNDFLQGNQGDDQLEGGPGDDSLYGGKDDDRVDGDLGRDTLFGNLGQDTLIGDPGFEVGNTAQEADILFGNRDNDLLHGGPGADTVFGGREDDFAYGGRGEDIVAGNRGNDTLLGDLGDDILLGDSAELEAITVGGQDLLAGGFGNDTLSGNHGNDTLLGGEGQDQMFGGEADDLMFGELGNDALQGGAGNDTLCGNEGEDTLIGDLGTDESVGSGGSQDILCGGAGDDQIFGNGGEDYLCGDLGNDLLHGGQDDDTLMGGEGNDELHGDDGNDTLVGGNGQDQFVLSPERGSDVITDFTQGEDLIVLDGVTFDQLTLEQSPEGTLVRFGEDILATLEGVESDLLTLEDFTTLATA